MPPPPTNLTPSIRGFVCKSCRIKLQIPPRASWLSRNFTAQKPLPRSIDRVRKGPPPSKTKAQPLEQTEEPFYRYFDETPDGVRTEAKSDPEEDELLEGLQEAVREIKDDVGEVSAEELEELDEDEEPSLHMEEWEDAMDAKIEHETNTSKELSPPPMSPTAEQFLKPQLPPDPDSIEIQEARYPRSTRANIRLLNGVLNKVVRDYGRKNFRMVEAIMLKLWKYYVLSRKALLSDPGGISPATWKILWGYLSLPDPTNIDRMAHVRRLGSDMQKAGLRLGRSTLLLYIEAVFVEGEPQTAIDLWRPAWQSCLQHHEDLLSQYLELGTRMFAENGDIDEARKTASIAINVSKDPNKARILIHVIQGCLASAIPRHNLEAWDIYLEFRKHMESRMEMDDYDAITGLFMRAGKRHEALAIFKDMMLTNDPAALQNDSLVTRDYKNLPSRFKNKFFFGKWIKKLIGNGDLDEAMRVIDLMRDTGICPDAKFTNGLIGAWLRSGTIRNRQLAEDMGWSMIAKRLEFVEAREQGVKALLTPLRAVKVAHKPLHKSATFNLLPPATIETFSILMADYVKGQKHEQLLALYRTLSKAKIKPNTCFMNTVFRVEPKFSINQREAYHTFLNDGVKPDVETFFLLWHNLKQRSMERHIRHRSFNARELFAEMMRWLPTLRAELGKDNLPEKIYNLIILSFGLADDQAGTAVALRALQRFFGNYPTDETARTIVLQITAIGVMTSARVRRLNLNQSSRERIQQVTRVLHLLQSERVAALENVGIVYDDLHGQAKSEEALSLISDLLRIIALQRNDSQHGRPDIVGLSKTAANEMGVPDCLPWVVYNVKDEEFIDV
ncbi:hypothetical protein DSL72_007970 [Monilinia vaccinii-corymbosi]|uniref:Pentacotripeptide-repeat region of PRORP domain-containing protein n=1 Tax=Monilinia vaccinii-corymbosi TaxID=61207 RepID=A0A8A3PJK0_9HELO|nr:hypothetical protein DSL72_007970 [Monilinia vaccinii-corymbosi]